MYTKTGLVFGFSRNQSLVAVIPGQKAPRTLLWQNSFWILSENYFEMSIIDHFPMFFAGIATYHSHSVSAQQT
jgi:hypothetical protein